MTLSPLFCVRSVFALILLALLGACSGGGGAVGSPELLEIHIQGFVVPIHPWPYGGPLGLVHLNPTITFDFGGAVDPASLPQGDEALGSIEIRAAGGLGNAARGHFHVEDDPALPMGNARRVVFQPRLPAAAGEGPFVAFQPDELYRVEVRGGASGLRVAGQALSSSVLTTFRTRPCGTFEACFEDPVAGAPYVIATFPEMVDPDLEAPALVNPAAVPDGTVQVYLSEALDPATVASGSVMLRRVSTQAPFPMSVTLSQPGTFARPDGVPANASRLSLSASEGLPPGVTLELVLESSLHDYGGNGVALFEFPDATPQRVFRTASVLLAAQPPLVEEFDDAQFLDTVQGPIEWSGNGRLEAVEATAYRGDGSDGVVIYGGGSHDIVTGPAPPPASACPAVLPIHAPDGVLNATTLEVGTGAVLRVFGTRPVEWKCTETAMLNGQIDGRAFASGGFPNCYPSLSASVGGANNLSSLGVAGGVGGPGGGSGGTASGSGAFRTARGESGQGPYIEDQPLSASSGDGAFGGGDGGWGGALSTIPGTSLQVAGMGGAGGSAFTEGGDGELLSGESGVFVAGCGAPVSNPPTPVARATGVPLAWTSPITRLVAGSGGGAGGDYFRNQSPGQDAQGSGGGGGGGAFRVSAAGTISLGWGAYLRMDGAPGAAGSLFSGAGGGGSGGMIWLRSASDIVIQSQVLELSCEGTDHTPFARCSGAPGRGGRGVILLEDRDGLVPGNINTPTMENVVITKGRHYGDATGAVYVGMATSTWRDTGYWNPSYRAVTLVSQFNPLPIPEPVHLTIEPAVEVLVQGTHGTVADPTVPDPLALTPWMSASEVLADPELRDALDGHRFVRFQLILRHWDPAGSAPTSYPSVDSLTIEWDAPSAPF